VTRYVTESLVFPYGVGEAFVDYAFPTNPAAGAQLSVTVQGEWAVRVLAARATLTTDANVANRLVSLDFVNSRGTTLVRNGASVLVTANTSNQAFEWGSNRALAEWNTGTPVWVPLLPLFLDPGFTLKFAVDSIQATDQLSSVSLVLEKWPTGPRGTTSRDVATPDNRGY
jgi:hypothetical protein